MKAIEIEVIDKLKELNQSYAEYVKKYGSRNLEMEQKIKELHARTKRPWRKK